MRRHHVRPGKIVIIKFIYDIERSDWWQSRFLFPMNTIIIIVFVLRVYSVTRNGMSTKCVKHIISEEYDNYDDMQFICI